MEKCHLSLGLGSLGLRAILIWVIGTLLCHRYNTNGLWGAYRVSSFATFGSMHGLEQLVYLMFPWGLGFDLTGICGPGSWGSWGVLGLLGAFQALFQAVFLFHDRYVVSEDYTVSVLCVAGASPLLRYFCSVSETRFMIARQQLILHSLPLSLSVSLSP